MPRVKVTDAATEPWHRIGDIAQGDDIGELSQDDRDARILYHQPGSEERLQLFEVCYGPNATIALHCHDEDEIIYVVDGELIVGERHLTPGSSVFIAGGTYYGFRSGEAGLRFLNFRPRADNSYHPRKAPAPPQP